MDESSKQKFLKHITPSLKQCVCFSDIPESKYIDVLKCLKARISRYKKGEMIKNISDKNMAGIIITGTLNLILYSESGSQISIAHYTSGQMFNESTACLEYTDNLTQIWAQSDCEVLFLDLSALFNEEKCTCRFKMKVAVNLLREMAAKTEFLNGKVRILAQKRLRDKIKVYFQSRKPDNRGFISLPFSRSEFAEYLCVDRSALSRELGRMQDEGLIRSGRNGFQILDKEFLK